MVISEAGSGRDAPGADDTQPLHVAPRSLTGERAGSMPRAGDRLNDRYELNEAIGRGGMSTVYRARDNRTGRDVAVKLFRPGTDLLDADERYRREVELLSDLDAPGLIAILDADIGDSATSSGVRYLVTELVDGCTLAERIRQSALPERQVARLGAALSRTLEYIHDRGIVHRDVKPPNILIPGSTEADLATPKLVDFGIAVTAHCARLTTDGATVGTANYLSPEQVRGDPVTSASDVYSLGLVLIEALTGALAYPGTGVDAALARLHRSPDIPGTVSRRLRAVLEDMTAPDPRDRPDAKHVAARLDDLTQPDPAGSLTGEILSLGQPVIGATKRRPAATGGEVPSRRRRVLVSAIAALSLAGSVALVGAITAAGPPAPEPPRSVIHAPQQAVQPHEPAQLAQAAAPSHAQAPRHRNAPPPLVPIIAAQQFRDEDSSYDVDGSSKRHKGEGKHNGKD
jgi:eukaryotic-like serine/threonine-protein kinase